MAKNWHTYIKNDPRWKAVRVEVLDRDDRTCQECSALDDLTVDHIVPLDVLFAGGVTPAAIEEALDPDNLVVLCRSCNGRKGANYAASDAIQRHTWANPKWPEIGDVLGVGVL